MSNSDVVRRSYQAYVSGDRAANEAVIGQDLHFTSPLDHRIDRDTYFERCWPNHEGITDFKFVRMVESGDEVIVTYEGTSRDGHVFRNTEILQVRDGQIIEVEVYFGWNVPHPAPPGDFLAS